MIGKETTGEQPIFTCKAHVFHIDPKTKRSWLPASASSITVSFFYDSARSLYRIISVEGTKAVINSTVTPAMTFTKTSQKFGQWSDMRANTVYGLGFSSEHELTKFIEKFQEVKEATRIALGKTNGAGPTTGTHGTSQTGSNASPITSRSVAFSDPGVIDPPTMQATTPCSTAPVVTTSDESADVAKSIHQRSQSFTQSESPKHQISVIDTRPSQTVSAGTQQTPPSAVVTTTNSTEQLRYENDRLKLALAHSSANARKWEIELSTLKNNNIRLTSALQESTANVDEWKRQLQFYKDENQRLRNKYVDLEASKTGTVDGTSGELTKELLMMRLKVETLEIELNSKDEEIKKLTTTKNSQDEKCKLLMQENAELQAGISLAQTQLDTALAAQESQRRVMDTLNTQLGMRIQELAGIHREIALALQT